MAQRSPAAAYLFDPLPHNQPTLIIVRGLAMLGCTGPPHATGTAAFGDGFGATSLPGVSVDELLAVTAKTHQMAADQASEVGEKTPALQETSGAIKATEQDSLPTAD